MQAWVVPSLLVCAFSRPVIPEQEGLQICEKLAGINETFTVSYIKSTPPTSTNVTVHYNPCGPVEVEGCAEDDRLCIKEYVNIDEKWYLTAVKPYGSVSNGVETYKYHDFEDMFVTYQGARWGDDWLYEDVRFHCSQDTNLKSDTQHRHGDDYRELVLNTPSACDIEFDRPTFIYHDRGWSKMQIFALLMLILIFALLGGIVFVWLFLRFAHTRGDLSADFGLLDALHDVFAGVAFNIGRLFRRSK